MSTYFHVIFCLLLQKRIGIVKAKQKGLTHHKCDVLFTFCEVFPEVRFYSMKKCTKLVFLEENSKKSDLFILITLNEGKNLSLTMQVLITYTFYIHKISCGLYFWASD